MTNFFKIALSASMILSGSLAAQTGIAKEDIPLSAAAIKALLPCALPLISKAVDEIGFASELRTTYGKFEFQRTDVAEPDGRLVISDSGKKICDIELSLNSEIYFSGKLKLVVLSGYSGSSQYFTFYRISEGGCEPLGTSKDKNYKLVKNLLDNRSGSRTCGRN